MSRPAQFGIEQVSAKLANHPIWVFFWLIAAQLFTYVAVYLSAQILPVVWDIMAGNVEGQGRLFWLIQSLPWFAVLIALMLWNQRVGVGPFAGNLGIPSGWGAYAIAATPILHLVLTSLASSLLAGGDPNWIYGEDGPKPQFQEAAYGISMFICIVLLAPLIEEITYRGVAFGFFVGRGASPAMSIFITAVLFTAFHSQYKPPALVPVFLMALYFGWLRVKTESVTAPILAHMATNFALFVIGYTSFGT